MLVADCPTRAAPVGRLVERSASAVTVAILACLSLPPLLGVGNLSYLPVAVLIGAIAWLLSRAEPRKSRRTWAGLFGCALLVRLLALLGLVVLARAAGGPFLGPDSAGYWRGGNALASKGFAGDVVPLWSLGLSGVGVCYLFGSIIRLFRADLFALQLLNCGFTALVGPLMFSWARTVVPRHALAIGLAVSLYPSLVALSAVDLLKDPSVVFAMVLALWALRGLVSPGWGRVAFALVAVVALGYLRMSRFYLVFYFEVAVVFGWLVAAVQRSLGPRFLRGSLAILAVFAAAEAGPAFWGWPTSPALMALGLRTTVNYPASIKEHGPGVLEKLDRRPPGRPQSRLLDGDDRGSDPAAGRNGVPDRPDVRVLLSSGYNEQDVVSRFAGKGLAGFIQKPYRPVALIERIRSLL